MRDFKLFNLPLLLLLSISCVGSSESESGDRSGDSSDPDALIGTWETCVNNSTTSFIQNAVFTETQITFTYESYTGLNCQSADKSYSRIFIYNYEATDTEIEAITQEVEYAIHTSSGVSTANSTSYCGFTDWSLNNFKDIINLSCSGATFSYGDVNTSEYSVSGDQLTYGVSTYTKVD